LDARYIAPGRLGDHLLQTIVRFVLNILPTQFTVARLEAGAPIPPWALAGGFCSVTRTANELSIVCESGRVPDGVLSETGWRVLEVQGPLAFDQVGIMYTLTEILAGRGISIFAVSTYDTDYILLKQEMLRAAREALELAGHSVRDL